MVVKINILYIFLFLILYSCNRENKYGKFENKEVKYYNSGKVKSIKYWNDNGVKEKLVLFSEQGDTIEYNENFIHHIENIIYSNDSTVHKYYFELDNDDYWLNEWIYYDAEGNIIPSFSEYIYIEDKADSFLITVITDNFYDLNLILFEQDDTTLLNRDTIRFDQKQQLLLSKKTLTKKRLLFVLDKKFNKMDGYSIISRKIYIT